MCRRIAFSGMILDKPLTSSTLIDQVEIKLPKFWECWEISRTRERVSPSGMGSCCTSSSSVPRWTMLAPNGSSLPAPTLGGCWCYIPSVLALITMHSSTTVEGKFSRIREFLSSPSTPESKLRVLTQS